MVTYGEPYVGAARVQDDVAVVGEIGVGRGPVRREGGRAAHEYRARRERAEDAHDADSLPQCLSASPYMPPGGGAQAPPIR
ncbi:hypothetical protein GCM10010365_38700 [Streptomyces poonensis]|uniref:Uncharacterized protein n=1 Tax=Streptomyces poonensis TaxID=68255 RepID=A0A918PLN5_9ACTN|nr:hypothetical protein GCM10010365_38700 [Streptomyces poonensis]GLJ91473.1 hypothetical protein GCM10017589_40800 [Streptomyces poonensis]